MAAAAENTTSHRAVNRAGQPRRQGGHEGRASAGLGGWRQSRDSLPGPALESRLSLVCGLRIQGEWLRGIGR